jgi:hypothetical protein
MSRRMRLLLPLLVLAALLGLSATALAHGGTSVKVVASGLDNPRHLEIGRWGAVYVAEAGRGGTETGPCIAGEEEGSQICAGATGAVTKIWRGHQFRVLTGLPSLADPATGSDALGPHDIALRPFGGAYVVVGLGANPEVRDQLGELGPGFGQLYKVSPFGHIRPVADISAFEAAENPDGGELDSNPYAVLTRFGRTVVVDAGGNSLLRVRHGGDISTLAVFPERLVPAPPDIPDLPPELPMQSVPTGVVVAPDGAYYVSELTGFPFVPGAARIHRVVPGSEPEVFAEGFTNVTDLAFDRRGNLYVLEFARNGILSGDPTGALYRVAPDGSRELVLSEPLEQPTGLAIGHWGEIYISNHGASAGTGEVLRVWPGH